MKLVHFMLDKTPIYIFAQAFKNSPSATNMPRGITEKAVPIWKYIFKKYRKDIHKGKTLKEQWAIAIAMFKNICTRRGIMPFDYNELQINVKEKRSIKTVDIHDRLRKGAKQALKEAKVIINNLLKEKLLEKSKRTNWVFDPTILANSRYHIAVYRKLKVGKDSSIKNILRELAIKYNFSKTPEYAFKTINSNITINFELDKKKSDIVYMYVTLSLTKDEAERLTEKKSGKTLESKLNRIGKGLIL